MEQRVRVLEDKFIAIEIKLDRVAADLKEVITLVKKLNDDVMQIKGTLSNMPSTWQVIGICGSMIGFVVSGFGGAFTIMHFMHP